MIGFIFLNSALDAPTSSVHSSAVLEFINSMLAKIGTTITLTENFVRKCAHFVEYSLLGTLILFAMYSYDLKAKKSAFATLISGFSVAFIDECIQLFSQGRSAQFSDVMLDFSGVCFSVAIILFIYKLLRKVRKY